MREKVKPEQERDPEIQGGLGGLGGLRAVVERDALTDTGTTAVEARGSDGNVREALLGVLLADVAVPADALVGGDEVLVVEALDIRAVLVEGVAVDGDTDLLDEALTNEIDVANDLGTGRGVSRGGGPVGSVGGRDGAQGGVDDHVVEEVTELQR